MAESGARKPRIRKTAPTVRERVEAAQKQAEAPPPKKLKGRIARPIPRLKLGQNRVLLGLGRVLAPVGKVLGWLVPRYFVNAWREVRQVSWTSRRETWRLTLAVFIFAIVFGALVAGVDKGLDEVFKKLVLK